MESRIFGADFDFPTGTDSMDVLEKFKKLAEILPTAQSLNMQIMGKLDTKDAFRIRLKGRYEEED